MILSHFLKLHKTVRKAINQRFRITNTNAQGFTDADVARAVGHYVEPDCQNIDPTGGENWRRNVPVREKAFAQLDHLFPDPEYRYTFLLADSGMGKSALMLNYLARWGKRKPKKLADIELVLVYLGSSKREDWISMIPNKANTVLLLDAFDEDIEAAKDHKKRLIQILELVRDFRHVLITCRTQFFSQDDEIPTQTGILRPGITRLGEDHEYIFHKIYLSPFSDELIEKYISSRWSVFQRHYRAEARKLCATLGDLTVRPLILSYLEDLLGERRAESYRHLHQLYDAIVRAWCRRESHWVDPYNLRIFSEAAANLVYSTRLERGGERLRVEEAEDLGKKLSLSLETWQIRGRSLLNRDAEGRLKFAHRTIMEYLYICNFIKNPYSQRVAWTDQMERFFIDIILNSYSLEKSRASSALIHASESVRRHVLTTILRDRPSVIEQFTLGFDTVLLESGNIQNEFVLVAMSSVRVVAFSRWCVADSYCKLFQNEQFIKLRGSAILPESSYKVQHISVDQAEASRHRKAAFGSKFGGQGSYLVLLLLNIDGATSPLKLLNV